MNKIKLSGTIVSEPTYSHTAFNEKFYSALIAVKRKSSTVDTLICIIPEVLMDGVHDGAEISLMGEIRTKNESIDFDRRILRIYVFAKEIGEYPGYDDQSVEIDGYICKEPKYRETPLGREITDVLLACNRERFKKSDYIPCIGWGRDAIRIAYMNIGDKVSAKGRLQNREYIKRHDDGSEEKRMAYELSLNHIRMGDDADENND